MNGQIFILIGFLSFLHLEWAPYNDAWLYKQKKSFFVQFMYLDEKPLSIVKNEKNLSRKSSLAMRTWAKQEWKGVTTVQQTPINKLHENKILIFIKIRWFVFWFCLLRYFNE